MKLCKKCGCLREIIDFYINHGKPRSKCKKCTIIRIGEWKKGILHPRIPSSTKICTICKQEKLRTEFNKNGKYVCSRCRECGKKYSKKWAMANPEKVFSNAVQNRFRNWSSSSISHHKQFFNVQISLTALSKLAESSIYCEYCGIVLNWEYGTKNRKIAFNSPTLDRKHNDAFLNISNVSIVCRNCNISKSNRSFSEFISYLKMILENRLKILERLRNKTFLRKTDVYEKDRSWWVKCTLRSHRNAGIDVRICEEELKNFTCRIRNCEFCGCVLSWGNKGSVCDTSPTLDRVNNETFIDNKNFIIVCHLCNRTKQSRTLQQFFDYCELIISRHKKVEIKTIE